MPEKKKMVTPYRLKVKKSFAGLGLFAEEPIKKGNFIIEYLGPIISAQEADKKGGKYLYEISSRRAIDGSVRWNLARYINHSCAGNCQPYNENGRIKIYAKRDILPGEELTYNYGKDYFVNIIGGKEKCLCADCRRRREEGTLPKRKQVEKSSRPVR